MQLGDPSVLETSSGEPGMAAAPAATAAAPPPAPEAATGPDTDNGNMMMMMMDATNSGDDNNNNNNNNKGLISSGGGNRWPRQETFALLKIRSDMDATFRDSSLKGPLWEEVSRKLGELGYNRSAKKCKEKFENVYKYHKRTKESRSGKPEGKTYKFFDQLQALENQFSISHASKLPPPSQPQPQSQLQPQLQSQLQPQSQSRPSNDPTTTISFIAAPTTTTTTIATTNATINPPSNITTTTITNPRNLPNINFFSSTTTTTTTTSTSSSTASDEDMEERYRKKRKLKDYFRRLTRQVLAKQEEMQKRFLEAIDKRERDRAAQQEAWRVQEMTRINREHDILVQERSTAAAKDAAVIAFLQKLSGGPPNPTPPPPPLPPANLPRAVVTTQTQSQIQIQLRQDPQPDSFPLPTNNHFEIQKANTTNGHQIGTSSASSSRWPKPEVHALIRLRTSMDSKYQENGPKGPLWEDISAGMQRLGYNRSAKRCKEKWENINKYFKKVKESNKQRREDSKTCPYFHELDALYKEKIKSNNNNNNNNGNHNNASLFGLSKPNHVAEMMMEPLMVQPEQQWRPPPLDQEGVNINNARHNNVGGQYDEVMKQREGEEDELEDDDDDNMEDEEEEEEDDEDGESLEEDDQEGRYEIAANNNNNNNKLPTVGTHS